MTASNAESITTNAIHNRVLDVQCAVNDLCEQIDDLVHELTILGVLEDVANETTNDNEESIL